MTYRINTDKSTKSFDFHDVTYYYVRLVKVYTKDSA